MLKKNQKNSEIIITVLVIAVTILFVVFLYKISLLLLGLVLSAAVVLYGIYQITNKEKDAIAAIGLGLLFLICTLAGLISKNPKVTVHLTDISKLDKVFIGIDIVSCLLIFVLLLLYKNHKNKIFIYLSISSLLITGLLTGVLFIKIFI